MNYCLGNLLNPHSSSASRTRRVRATPVLQSDPRCASRLQPVSIPCSHAWQCCAHSRMHLCTESSLSGLRALYHVCQVLLHSLSRTSRLFGGRGLTHRRNSTTLSVVNHASVVSGAPMNVRPLTSSRSSHAPRPAH